MINNRFDRIDEFLIHIADIALSNDDIKITPNFIYSNLVCYKTKREPINENFKVWLDIFKFKKNLTVIIPDEYSYFCQFSNNVEDINDQNNIKIFIPQDRFHILNSVNLIFDFLANNNITHVSKVSSIIRNDDIIIRLTNFNDVNKIANYINSNKYIQSGLMDCNPFSMTDGNVSYAVDSKISYNYEISTYISDYVNIRKNENRLHYINCDDFRNYVYQKYKNIFVNGKELKKFLIENNINSSIVKNVVNHMELAELIISSLDKNKNLSHFISHYEKVNSIEYQNEINNYIYNMLLNKIGCYIEKPITTNRQKEELLQNAIIKTANKYTLEFAKKGLKNYITNNKVNGFTRDDGIRQKIIDNLDNIEALEIIKKYNYGEYNVDKYVEKIYSIDIYKLRQQVLSKASILTYKKYGRKQLEFAIKNIIKNKKYNGFVNEQNARKNLISIISANQVEKIIKETLNDCNYPGSIIQEKFIDLYLNKIEKEVNN